MISVEALHKHYGRQHVLNNVQLRLTDGQCVAFIGPNGCGKTTLMKCMLGLVTPDAGRVLIDGVNVHDNPWCREHVGFMPQKGSFPQQMTVGQTVQTICSVRDYKGELDDELLEAYEMKRIWDKRTWTLSGGMSQKLSAALAFLFRPQILILDEPEASLDPIAAEVLKEKVRKEVSRGRLVFVTSHLLNEIAELATQVVLMDEGQILLHQPVSELLEQTGESTLGKSVMNLLRRRKHANDL